MFSQLKVNEVPVLVSVPLQITVPVPIPSYSGFRFSAFCGRTESFDRTQPRYTVKILLSGPLPVADPGEGPGRPAPPISQGLDDQPSPPPFLI